MVSVVNLSVVKFDVQISNTTTLIDMFFLNHFLFVVSGVPELQRDCLFSANSLCLFVCLLHSHRWQAPKWNVHVTLSF
jgi:hypothetical protein